MGKSFFNSTLFKKGLKIVSPMTGEVLSTDSLGVKGIVLPPVILSNAVFIMDENSNVFHFE